MIGHDDVDARVLQQLDARFVGGAVVGRDQDVRAVLRLQDALSEPPGQTVALIQAMAHETVQEAGRVPEAIAQHRQERGVRAEPVGVVVGLDADALPAHDGRRQTVRGEPNVRQAIR